MPISQNTKILKLRLFFYSFLILFLELSLIRFIPANIRLIGYFANIILLATFLGMGCGMMLANRPFSFQKFFPYLLLLLVSAVSFFKLNLILSSPNAIFFSAVSEQSFGLEPQYILPLIFLLVALINIPIAQQMGKLFTVLPPLEAYSCDIGGSIAGTLVFTVCSFLMAPPLVWFFIVTLIFCALSWEKTKTFALGVAVCLVCLILVQSTEKGALWSPYYKITVQKINDGISFDPTISIAVNNIPHQYISHYSLREPFYYLPYQLFHDHTFKKILIIGSGGGADTATVLGLEYEVQHIDAVEIDPVIANLGRLYNPDHPYSDPRVSLHVDDGRSFLQNSKESYDLIIYALTDSLALTAQSSNIRLESFIFTTDAFRLVKNHLAPNGLFVLYNYYRDRWLIDKIAAMTTDVFGYPPVVILYGEEGNSAVIMTGPKISLLSEKFPRYSFPSGISLSRDDWPFLYLKQPSIPWLYVSCVAILIAISIILVALVSWKEKQRVFNLRFFLFGAGFMLLETKSLATFALLFGSTWLVNSLVIIAILLFVLIANVINSRGLVRTIVPFYVLLFIVLTLQIIIPPSEFIGLSFWMRLLAAGCFYFCPIFFANIIFSNLFKSSHEAQAAFGINLLGSLAGGFLEYSSMAVGYQIVTVFVIIFYAIAFIYHAVPIFRNR